MKATFHCIDGHTCGNPVRLVAKGGPKLRGNNISEFRLDFLERFDWIRTGLMFEPRGHDMMSGSILYPPFDSKNDAAVLFIETSGCLPMCGHGLIGTITMAVEEDLIKPKNMGVVRVETPAGLVVAQYKKSGDKIDSVKFKNVPSFLYKSGLEAECPDLGSLLFDVAFGGNFYAIVDPQTNFKGIEHYRALDLISWSPVVRRELNQKYEFIHPLDNRISGLSHILWTGTTESPDASARNAVFYGEKAIDRSPCGTGTSARMAQWAQQGKLAPGERFVHESYIGSQFIGVIEEIGKCGEYETIVPSIEGWAKITGYNQIIIDPEDDPYAYGFQVM